MNRYFVIGAGVAALVNSLLVLSYPAEARGNEAQQQAVRVQQEEARQAQQQAVMAQQEQARRAQEQEFKVQQEAARKVQEQEQIAQEQARRIQEQALKAQEENARRMQERALASQQQAARMAQGQALKEQEQAARQAQKEQALILRKNAPETVLPREAFPSASADLSRGTNIGTEEINKHVAEQMMPPSATNKIGTAAFIRPTTPHALKEGIPLNKATPLPVLEKNATPEQQEHAQDVVRNLQTHLIAVPVSQAPPNISVIKNISLRNYTNNYRALIYGQPIYINNENTMVYPVQAGAYPYWYQPEPNFIFANGFVLGSVLRVGLDWLRWNWHPYYGPPPEGFACASDYVPTPWVYVPAYGLWMQPGTCAYAASGPDYDYTGPITVEVLEPRHIHVRDPFSGWERTQTINVIYLYNAYFYPEYERWGYMNRHGYFIWLNI